MPTLPGPSASLAGGLPGGGPPGVPPGLPPLPGLIGKWPKRLLIAAAVIAVVGYIVSHAVASALRHNPYFRAFCWVWGIFFEPWALCAAVVK